MPEDAGRVGLINRLSGDIDRALGGLVRRGQRVAMINFANHSNTGDSALWLGQLAALRRIGARLVYQCSWASYRKRDLARRIGRDDVILFNGGGNFGDLYPENQSSTRLKVLHDFPGTRTIQLPQSIYFADPANREATGRVIGRHQDFTLMVRDRQSLDCAQASFSVPVVLCPDMAFAIGPLSRAGIPRTGILWLARQDRESTGYRLPSDMRDVERVDWLSWMADEADAGVFARSIIRLNSRLHADALRREEGHAFHRRVLAATFRPAASFWLRRGCEVLSRGRVVITDRLHGHILCLLMGIPHVLLDNCYGKIRSLYQTWTSDFAGAEWADEPGEALEKARHLAGQSGEAR